MITKSFYLCSIALLEYLTIVSCTHVKLPCWNEVKALFRRLRALASSSFILFKFFTSSTVISDFPAKHSGIYLGAANEQQYTM